MASVFADTKRFVQAVTILNNISAKKVPQLAKRLLSQKGGFTEEEQENLREVFSLTAEELTLVLEGVAYIFEQAAYTNLKPNKLMVNLTEAKVAEDQATALSTVWDQQREKYMTALRNKTLGGPLTLEDVRWRLQLNLGDEFTSKSKDVLALMSLDVKMATDTSGETTESLNVQMNAEQLTEFYSQLETIQAQIDALSASA